MKKATLLLVFLLVGIGVYSKSPMGPHQTGIDWSVDVLGGINLFDADIAQTSNRFLPASPVCPIVGLGINCQITNRYGLLLDYNFIPVAANTKGLNIRTKINVVSLNATVNLFNLLFSPSYSYLKHDFSFYASLGLGAARYYYHVEPSELTLSSSDGSAITMPFSVYGIYDFSNHISIGAKITYFFFNKDDLEGVQSLNYKGLYGDSVDALLLFLRYRL